MFMYFFLKNEDCFSFFFFFQAEDGIRDATVTGVQTCALPIFDGILKGFGWAANPADVTGFANSASFPSIMEYLIDEPQVGTLVIASAGADTQAEQVIGLRQRTGKGIAFLWTGSRGETAGLAKLKHANIPVFYTPDTVARGLRRLLDYHAWRDRRLSDGFAGAPALSAEQHRAIARLRAAGRTTLSESESKQLIAAWGIAVTRG